MEKKAVYAGRKMPAGTSKTSIVVVGRRLGVDRSGSGEGTRLAVPIYVNNRVR